MTKAAASAATTRADITPNRHPYRGGGFSFPGSLVDALRVAACAATPRAAAPPTTTPYGVVLLS